MVTVTNTNTVKSTSKNRTYKKHPLKKKLDKLLDDFRWAVKPQIAEFKAKELAKYDDGFYRDALTGYRIKDSSKAQCDHNADKNKSFRQLAYNFLTLHKVDISHLTPRERKRLCREFAEYHRLNCSLRIVSESRNRWLFYKHRKNDIHWKEFYKICSVPSENSLLLEVN
ncbi:MAG: hypothetical protein RLZZ507_3757 [Cyanobacteriota bacterium]|jgi:hypothetical protein